MGCFHSSGERNEGGSNIEDVGGHSKLGKKGQYEKDQKHTALNGRL